MLRFFDDRVAKADVDLVRCAGCGFVFLDRDCSSAVERDYYAGHVRVRLGLSMTPEIFVQELQRQSRALDEIARCLPIRPGLRVLDLGCGTGYLIERLRRLGCEARGLDLDADLVRFMRDELHLTADCATLDSLDPDLRFEAITLCDVLEHLPDPLSTLRSIRARLTPGGRCVIKVPNWRVGRGRVLAARLRGRLTPNLHVQGEHLNYFDPDSLLRAFRLADFARASIRPTVPTYEGLGFDGWDPLRRSARAALVLASRLLPERRAIAPCIIGVAECD